jgi:hypothetical protein
LDCTNNADVPLIGVQVYLAEVRVENFSSVLGGVVVPLRPEVTVRLGHNSAGKRSGPAGISCLFRGLGPAASGTFLQALVQASKHLVGTGPPGIA